MSGWVRTHNKLLYAHGKSGSTSLAHLVHTGVATQAITQWQHDCADVNQLVESEGVEPLILIREPRERFVSGMWQLVSELLTVALPRITRWHDLGYVDDMLDEPQYWRDVTEQMFCVLGFDCGNPQLSDREAYHLGHYLQMFSHLKQHPTVHSTSEINSVLQQLGHDAVVHNSSTEKPLGEYYTVFKNAIVTTPSWITVLKWLEPERDRYADLSLRLDYLANKNG